MSVATNINTVEDIKLILDKQILVRFGINGYIIQGVLQTDINGRLRFHVTYKETDCAVSYIVSLNMVYIINDVVTFSAYIVIDTYGVVYLRVNTLDLENAKMDLKNCE